MGKSKLWIKASAVFSSVFLVTVFIAYRTGTLQAYLFVSPHLVDCTVNEDRPTYWDIRWNSIAEFNEDSSARTSGPVELSAAIEAVKIMPERFADANSVSPASYTTVADTQVTSDSESARADIQENWDESTPASPKQNVVNQNVVISSSKSIVFDNSYFPSLPGIQSVVPITKLRTSIAIEGLPPVQTLGQGLLFAEDGRGNLIGNQPLLTPTIRLVPQAIPMTNDWITGSPADPIVTEKNDDPHDSPYMPNDTLAAVLELDNQSRPPLGWNEIVGKPRFAISGGSNAGSRPLRLEPDEPQLQDFLSESVPDEPSASAKVGVTSGLPYGFDLIIIEDGQSTNKRTLMSGSKSLVLIPAPQYLHVKQDPGATPQK